MPVLNVTCSHKMLLIHPIMAGKCHIFLFTIKHRLFSTIPTIPCNVLTFYVDGNRNVSTTEVPLRKELNLHLLLWSCSVSNRSDCGCTGQLPGVNVCNFACKYVCLWLFGRVNPNNERLHMSHH